MARPESLPGLRIDADCRAGFGDRLDLIAMTEHFGTFNDAQGCHLFPQQCIHGLPVGGAEP